MQALTQLPNIFHFQIFLYTAQQTYLFSFYFHRPIDFRQLEEVDRLHSHLQHSRVDPISHVHRPLNSPSTGNRHHSVHRSRH